MYPSVCSYETTRVKLLSAQSARKLPAAISLLQIQRHIQRNHLIYGTRRRDVALTSVRRDHVASTSVRRHVPTRKDF